MLGRAKKSYIEKVHFSVRFWNIFFWLVFFFFPNTVWSIILYTRYVTRLVCSKTLKDRAKKKEMQWSPATNVIFVRSLTVYKTSCFRCFPIFTMWTLVVNDIIFLRGLHVTIMVVVTLFFVNYYFSFFD